MDVDGKVENAEVASKIPDTESCISKLETQIYDINTTLKTLGDNPEKKHRKFQNTCFNSSPFE